MVSIGFLATSLALYNMTRLDLDVSFGHIVLWRVFQVLGLSFIFIPISTLNYVGVPREKNNQISLLKFRSQLGRQPGHGAADHLPGAQQPGLPAEPGQPCPSGRLVYRDYMAQTPPVMRLGQGAEAAAHRLRRAYQRMLRQASMLSYKNAFFILIFYLFRRSLAVLRPRNGCTNSDGEEPSDQSAEP